MLGFMETPINHFFNERIGSKTLEAFTRGPLAAHLSAYAQQLFEHPAESVSVHSIPLFLFGMSRRPRPS